MSKKKMYRMDTAAKMADKSDLSFRHGAVIYSEKQ